MVLSPQEVTPVSTGADRAITPDTATPTEAAIRPATITTDDAAVYVGMSESYLRKARRFGYGPAYIPEGRAIRYTISDLNQWLDSQRVRPGGRAA